MAYQKRNFKKDQLLTAEDLNAMDDQIALNEESAKKANDDTKNKLDKSAVVQGKGGSETAVMSQAAATVEFDKLSEEIGDFRTQTPTITMENPYLDISAFAPFVRGRLFDGVLAVNANNRYRVSTDTKIRVEERTTFHVKEGFKASFQFFNDDGTFRVAGSWVTGDYIVEPSYGNNFKIMIARSTEDTNEVANVREFTAAITVSLKSIVKINEGIEDIHEEIEDIHEEIRKENLPGYWIDYLESQKSDILNAKCAIGNHGVCFAYFTDYHISNNTGRTSKILTWLKKNIGLDTIIFGGDILQTESTREECINGLNNFETMFRDLDVMNVFGNHDKNPYGASENQLSELNDCYPLLFQNNESKTNCSNTNNLFYYFDNPTQKVRFLVLNTHASVYEIVDDTPQIAFMVETLSNTPEGWNIVVLPHIHYEVNSGAIELSSCGGYVDKIIGDFMNRRASEKYGVVYDFTQAKAKVCAIISGHIHNDYNEMKAYGVPSITTACDAINGSAQGISPTYVRSEGTVTEQAIDLFFVDTTARTIKTIRLGAGENRVFTF